MIAWINIIIKLYVQTCVPIFTFPATKDEDFIPPPPDYTLHFLPEENRKLYDITIINDNIFEQNETFSMSIRALLNEGDISETELKTGNRDTVELPILITEIVRIENNVIVTIEDDDGEWIVVQKCFYLSVCPSVHLPPVCLILVHVSGADMIMLLRLSCDVMLISCDIVWESCDVMYVSCDSH